MDFSLGKKCSICKKSIKSNDGFFKLWIYPSLKDSKKHIIRFILGYRYYFCSKEHLLEHINNSEK